MNQVACVHWPIKRKNKRPHYRKGGTCGLRVSGTYISALDQCDCQVCQQGKMGMRQHGTASLAAPRAHYVP